MSIRIGILGYGNLGRGVECAIKHNPDLELVAVFTPVSYTHLMCIRDSPCSSLQWLPVSMHWQWE